ncbi:MAG: helix-turn-helix transcriptional regulator [Oscillospiraceae bacterium]|nr:helix-turn-helix transcriptional regulator [Oscillospiraceae bacterium]
MNIEIAGRLFEMRKKHNLSQEELAAKIGVSRQAVSKWERAESSPDTDNLIQLARLYEVSLDELLFTNEPVEPSSATYSFSTEGKSDANTGAGTVIINVASDNPGSGRPFLGEGVYVDGGQDDRGGRKEDEDGWDEWDEDEDDDDWDEWDEDDNDDDLTEEEKAKKKMLNSIPVPVLISVVYLAIGFFTDVWHPTWLLFLLIPVYYQCVAFVMARDLRKKLNCVPVGVFATTWFLLIGFFTGVWHPTWAVFLLIPLYHSLVNALVRK